MCRKINNPSDVPSDRERSSQTPAGRWGRAGPPEPGGRLPCPWRPQAGPSRGPRPQPCCEGSLSLWDALACAHFPRWARGRGQRGPGLAHATLAQALCPGDTVPESGQCSADSAVVHCWRCPGHRPAVDTLGGTHWSRPSPAESLPPIAQPLCCPPQGAQMLASGRGGGAVHGGWALGTWALGQVQQALCCGFWRKHTEKVLEQGAA